MATEQEVKVEEQDPIVKSVVEQEISLEEETIEDGVEASEEVNWEAEAKKFQSMYDKKTVELNRNDTESEQLRQLKGLLEERPELVDTIERELAGESKVQDNFGLESPESFDPWEAYHKPESASYKYRVSNEQKLVHDTVDKELAKLKGQMAMNNLKSELVSEHNLGKQDAEEFLKFATQPKANLPIETLIKVWREDRGEHGVQNENKKAVQKAKSIPKPAGVLQGGEIPQKNEADQAWDRIMKSGSLSKLKK